MPLVNKTRVANGGLPPVTVDGPPDELGCVPRTLSGACGSVWDALREALCCVQGNNSWGSVGVEHGL